MTQNSASRRFLRAFLASPHSVSAVIVVSFTLTGIVTWNVLEWMERKDSSLQQQQQQQQVYKDTPNITTTNQMVPMTLEEARLRAMIEDAKQSTWRENLKNAMYAQEHFLFPERAQSRERLDFSNRIEKRGHEIMQDQHQQLEKERQRQEEEKVSGTHFWR